MSGSIFISYRRQDTQHAAARLSDRLVSEFSSENVFFDVETLPAGVDFVEEVTKRIDACDAFVVMIGKLWLDIEDAEGGRRIDNPEDHVRTEIVRALSANKRIFPVLVDGAVMPARKHLPDELKPLAHRHARKLQHESFRADCDQLVGLLKDALAGVESDRQAAQRTQQEAEQASKRAEQERQAEEAAERRREELESAARQRQQQENGERAAAAAALAQALAESRAKEEKRRQERDTEPRDLTPPAEPELARIVSEAAELGIRLDAQQWARLGSELDLASGDTHTFRIPVEGAASAREFDLSRRANGRWAVVSPARPSETGPTPVSTWPRQDTRPRSRVSRRLLLAGGAAAAAAAVLTRNWWLPSGVMEITEERGIFSRDGSVYDASFSATGDSVAMASADRTVMVSPLSEAGLHILEGHADYVMSVSFAPGGDKSRVLSASLDGTAGIWSGKAYEAVTTLAIGNSGGVHARWSPDGTRIASADGKEVGLWDANSGKLMARSPAPGVTDIAFAASGKLFATASLDRTARLWDAYTCENRNVLDGHEGQVFTAEFSPDDAYLLTGSADHTARLWDLRAISSAPMVLRQKGEIKSARFSPDGLRIITTSADGTGNLWSRTSGGSIAPLSGHEGPVFSGRFSPNGRLVVTASEDDTARLWDGRTGEALAVFVGHKSLVFGASFSPAGDEILTWSGDKTARIWRIPSALLARA